MHNHCLCFAAVTVSEPVASAALSKSGRKHSIPKSSDALESGWDLFYKSGNSGSKAKAKPKMVTPKVVNATTRRGSVSSSKDTVTDKK